MSKNEEESSRSLAVFYDKVNRCHELFTILTNQKRCGEATYCEAVGEILKMISGPDAVVLVMALIESHTKLKERLFDEGVLEIRVGDCCTHDETTH